MITIRMGKPDDWQDIARICSENYRTVYKDISNPEYIERVIQEFYTEKTLRKELTSNSKAFHGYWLAEEEGEILGCIGGGVDEENKAQVYVFYVALSAQRRGIGHSLLEAMTSYQKETYGSTEQWVAVTKGNPIGIPFYEKEGFSFSHETPSWIDASQGISCHFKREI
ncbi:GNAT family N-acetyltransferase [Streptococcus minor]|uniref:GNAT family N-acetyltransferase n=1 Tax=Streptococcus minor TaxID=229549 RepID=UPI00039AE09F|nr:GNAT family N-acetyltransferase [Streptococcus minor]